MFSTAVVGKGGLWLFTPLKRNYLIKNGFKRYYLKPPLKRNYLHKTA